MSTRLLFTAKSLARPFPNTFVRHIRSFLILSRQPADRIIPNTHNTCVRSLKMAAVEENLDLSQFTISNATPINFLECQTAFDGLSDKEKLYSHYLLKACWEGSLICLLQTSAEAARIFQLFQNVFSAESVAELKEKALKADNGPAAEEFDVSCLNDFNFTDIPLVPEIYNPLAYPTISQNFYNIYL